MPGTCLVSPTATRDTSDRQRFPRGLSGTGHSRRAGPKSCLKNAVFSPPEFSDEQETAFLALRRGQMGQKRRFWPVGKARCTKNGVFDVSARPDGRKTAFLACRKIQMLQKRRFWPVGKFGRTKNGVFEASCRGVAWESPAHGPDSWDFSQIPRILADSWVSGIGTRSAGWLERSAVQVERSAGWMDGSACWTESVMAGVPGAVTGIPGAALGTLGAAAGVLGAQKVRWERGLDGRERGRRSSGRSSSHRECELRWQQRALHLWHPAWE